MKELAGVSVTSEKLTTASIDHLQSLPKLIWLDCSGKHVDDSWVPHITRLTNLEYVKLVDTTVTIDGINAIVRLPKLHDIYFCDMAITDETLDQLRDVSRLTRLGVSNTKVTPAGIKRFQTRLPTCIVRQF